MSRMHYKASGTLDKRYSSSKAAMNSGYSSGGYNWPSTSSTAASPSAGHSGSSYGSSSGGYSTSSQLHTASSDLHYSKVGLLDMRYTSSKQAVASAAGVSSGNSSRGSYQPSSDSHCTKKEAPNQAECSSGASGDSLHYTRKGLPDMRYRSSKVAAEITAALDKMKINSDSQKKTDSTFSNDMRTSIGIPSDIPKTKRGIPDMRTKAAIKWVEQEADRNVDGPLPSWVPHDKFGSIDMKTAVGRAYHAARQTHIIPLRKAYYGNRMNDATFKHHAQQQRKTCVPPPTSQPVQQVSTENSNIAQIEYSSLVFDTYAKNGGVIGRGSFGVVLRAKWNDLDVAVKKLHLDQLSMKEKATFRKELVIMESLGAHPNFVLLHGYCLTSPCIIMELISLGSLAHLLHYNDDPVVEAKMTDGRIKKKLILGIADGMHQLRAAGVIHGDLKPQNVLVSDDYEAKITDFGLATLRSKTSSTISPKQFDDSDGEAYMIGGTAGYMAPELLDSTSPPDYPVDVYSFGIVVNEIIFEEEPFSDQYANFAARGPFGAANYAKLGKRPTISQKTPKVVKALIKRCWAADPTSRPTFEEIVEFIIQENFTIPDSF